MLCFFPPIAIRTVFRLLLERDFDLEVELDLERDFDLELDFDLEVELDLERDFDLERVRFGTRAGFL